MAAADFIAALGKLLSDGALRDAFADNPKAVAAQLRLSESDCAQLVPADLEFQADILIRKRLASIRRMIPRTCALLGKNAWAIFHSYARLSPLKPGELPPHDAYGFCLFLQRRHQGQLCKAELNRLRFALSGARLALHIIAHTDSRNRTHRALQCLTRFGRRRETTLYLSA